MKLHRFFVGQIHNKWGKLELGQTIWVDEPKLINQLLKVLRYKIGENLILFNYLEEKLYKIVKIDYPKAAKLELVTEIKGNVPEQHIYLFWSLLKKDKNDWVLQKATELGVRNFVPLIADRSEKTGFDIERAKKIIIEAAEQCGRFDIPNIREPIYLIEALTEYVNLPLFVCEQGDSGNNSFENINKLGLLIGPEGGWSDAEKQLFLNNNIKHLCLSNFTLRAETAVIAGIAKILID